MWKSKAIHRGKMVCGLSSCLSLGLGLGLPEDMALVELGSSDKTEAQYSRRTSARSEKCPGSPFHNTREICLSMGVDKSGQAATYDTGNAGEWDLIRLRRDHPGSHLIKRYIWLLKLICPRSKASSRSEQLVGRLGMQCRRPTMVFPMRRRTHLAR
ncbi:hypothetical protein B0J13DRAFT_20413 [Dactylonectria estremocensis]|uniref:Uncharacterized protein n=1 Tax=Dactylonectria estremocensis TaxID=1079267 RepID=A0A9P9FKV8_9HYPO|nr:hypothetical protein B0J13DRAFT_20413 [Dactylonectria estremocensis]